MTAADRLRDAGRGARAAFTVAAALAAASVAAAGCSGTPASPTTPTARPPGPADALTLTEYRDRVEAAAAVLSTSPHGAATRPAAGGQPDALATARASLGQPLPVTLRSNAMVEAQAEPALTADDSTRLIRAEPLLPKLGAAERTGATTARPGRSGESPSGAGADDDGNNDPDADGVGVLARLEVVRAEIDASLSDATAAHVAALDHVLADPAFRDPRSLWQRGWEWVSERFRRWWGNRGLPSGAGETALQIGQIIGWAVAIVVVAATALWVARLVARLSDAARVPAAPGAPPSTPAEARARAAADAGAGDFRSAVRQLYLAAVLVLEENGLLRPDRSRTNREQLASLQGGEALRAHMAAVVDTFDRVWYGVTVPDGATFHAYAADIHELEALAKRAIAPPPVPTEPGGPTTPTPSRPSSAPPQGGAP